MRAAICILLAALGIAASSAAAFKIQGPRWDIERGPITYRIHADGSDDVSDGADLEAIRAAFAAWSCIEGSGLRFVEGEPLTERDEAQVEGEVRVFFDETGAVGLNSETRSRSFFEAFIPDQFAVRDAAVIVFNGVDFTWSSEGFQGDADDIQTFALIEIAIVLGLAQPCDANGQNCTNPDETVLAGFIPLEGYDGPGSDDEDGIRELYGTDDGSSCEGPFRVGERCACNDDCVEGHVCAPADDGASICTPTCTSENVDCAIGYGCLLALDDEGEGASGFCARDRGEGLPVGATCNRDGDCSAGLCVPVAALGRNACRVSCDTDDDCPDDYACAETACVFAGEVAGEACAGGCGCAASEERPSSLAAWAVAALGFVVIRRRRAVREAS